MWPVFFPPLLRVTRWVIPPSGNDIESGLPLWVYWEWLAKIASCQLGCLLWLALHHFKLAGKLKNVAHFLLPLQQIVLGQDLADNLFGKILHAVEIFTVVAER